MILFDESKSLKIYTYCSDICTFLRKYKWTQDAYVSDFFFKNHWETLPESWRNSFSEMSTDELCWLIDTNQKTPRHVLPLTLLSFRACTQAYSVERQQVDNIPRAWRKSFSFQEHITDRTSNMPCQEQIGDKSSKQNTCSNEHSLDKEEKTDLTSLSGQENECETEVTSDTASNYSCSQSKLTSESSNCCSNQSKVSSQSGDHFSSQSKFSSQPCDINISQSHTDKTAVTEDGVLHYFFRKHVKPKKQHEIYHLAKVIQLLSNQIGCSHVVDVGGGLGHLSRLLSLGLGLKVTSVEASDGHAPKANKYDREVDREIKKKQKQTADGFPGAGASCSWFVLHTPDLHASLFWGVMPSRLQHMAELGNSEASTNLPHHVTSMIYPNTTAKDFIDIIQSQHIGAYNSADQFSERFQGRHSCRNEHSTHSTSHSLKHVNSDVPKCKIASKIAKLDSVKLDELESCPTTVIGNSLNKESVIAMDCSMSTVQACDEANCKKPSDSVDREKLLENTRTASVKTSDSLNIDDMYKDIQVKDSCELSQEGNNCGESRAAQDFILTGLHACGDLTPTFLRFFVNCSTAKGLASVGCCYMKLSDISHKDAPGAIGYPMSSFVKSLPHHELSYNARELACHFADTYSKRLKENTPHLKIHSYRAALEWIANQLYPDFKRSAVQIPAKKTNKMDFESYARLGLTKLGISPDLLTQELLDTAQGMVKRWKDVVAFYTLRLSLAPVVETLLLLDRMIFLHEHGLSSILMPIFDPNISPRNLVLVAWK